MTDMGDWRFAVVVGASSGIGREVCRQLAQSGCKVAAVARRLDRLEELAKEFPGLVLPFGHDVRNVEEVPGLFQGATKALGGLDLFVYASGVMPEVGFHEFNTEKDRLMVETNVMGLVAWVNAVADRMQNTKHGSIVAIGSVAGDRGRSKQPVYNASKAFLATYMEAVRNRVSRYGVKVVTVKPGPVATEMTQGLHMRGTMPVEVAAAKIIRLAGKTGEHYLKPMHRLVFYVIKRVPSPIFRRLKI